MARHRLINCEFLNAGSFKVNVSNRAKLLYFMMISNGDDRGFVDSTQNIIITLENNDSELDKVERLELLENTYNSALNELIDKGYLYEFIDNHQNKVHLIRHWFFHNKLVKGLWTNYRNFLELVHLENNEYILNSKKPFKEDKIKETKLNQTKLNQINMENETDQTETTQNEFEQDILESEYPFELTEEEKERLK